MSQETMTDDEIRELCRQLDTTKPNWDGTVGDQLWDQGERAIPFMVEAFHNTRKWQGRAWFVCSMMIHAPGHEAAYRLGIAGLSDRATLVRYRACMLLARLQRAEAIPHLEELLDHPDEKTVADAKAAIDSIRSRNVNHFLDRGHTGQMFIAASSDEVFQIVEEQSTAKRPWWKLW